MTRSHEHEIEIHAPVEDVWRALTDSEELTRWYVEEARVEPGEGGSYWVSWGGGIEGRGRVDAWEPGLRLRLVAEPSEEWSPPPEEPIVEEWHLETRGGRTIVRLVHSGIPDSSDWDGYYDGTKSGWPGFFQALRHYLERHPGKPRRTRTLVAPLTGSRDEAWQKLEIAFGLEAAELGGRFSAAPGGQLLEGDVLALVPGSTAGLTLEQLDDGLLAVAMGDTDGHGFVWASLATYGDTEPEGAERLAEELQRLFPAG